MRLSERRAVYTQKKQRYSCVLSKGEINLFVDWSEEQDVLVQLRMAGHSTQQKKKKNSNCSVIYVICVCVWHIHVLPD